MAYVPCKYLAAVGRITKNSAYPCKAPIPDVVLPRSVTKHYASWGWSKSYVSKEDCAECPCFEARTKGEA